MDSADLGALRQYDPQKTVLVSSLGMTTGFFDLGGRSNGIPIILVFPAGTRRISTLCVRKPSWIGLDETKVLALLPSAQTEKAQRIG